MKMQYTHQVQFGILSFDAIQIDENKYLLYVAGSIQGKLLDNGNNWIKYSGWGNRKIHEKNYNEVIVIPFEQI